MAASPGRGDCQANLHHPERGAFGHHAQIARHGDFRAAAKRRPFDRGNRRHREGFQSVERLGHDPRQAGAVEAGQVAVELEEIAAGAEGAAGAGHDQGAQILRRLGPFDRGAEIVHRLPGQCVARLRTLDRDLTETVFHRERHRQFHHQLLDRLLGGPYTDRVGV